MTEETENARRAAIGGIPESIISGEAEEPVELSAEEEEARAARIAELRKHWAVGDWVFAMVGDGERHGFRAGEEEIAFEGDPIVFIEAIQQQLKEAREEGRTRVADMEADARKSRTERETMRQERDDLKKDRDTLRRQYDRLVEEKRRKK